MSFAILSGCHRAPRYPCLRPPSLELTPPLSALRDGSSASRCSHAQVGFRCEMRPSERDLFCCVRVCRSHSVGGLGRIWNSSCSQNRLQEPRGRHRLSTVIQPLRQNAGEVVDLTVDEDGESKLCSMNRTLFPF